MVYQTVLGNSIFKAIERPQTIDRFMKLCKQRTVVQVAMFFENGTYRSEITGSML